MSRLGEAEWETWVFVSFSSAHLPAGIIDFIVKKQSQNSQQQPGSSAVFGLTWVPRETVPLLSRESIGIVEWPWARG